MTNLQLSPEEMQLVGNPAWILTKHRIIEKVYIIFGNLSAQMQAFLQARPDLLSQEVLQLPPKISKGEQYEAMPYVVLDYPRLFTKQDVFAVRSFFWWGHYFSITLHLKGVYLEQWYKKIAVPVAEKEFQDLYFSVEGNEFSFNLSGKNYCSAGNALHYFHPQTERPLFLKISSKISFEHWDTAQQLLMQAFERFMRMADNA